jgi:hypothetical protein
MKKKINYKLRSKKRREKRLKVAIELQNKEIEYNRKKYGRQRKT